ncbi:hypothetical protein H6P81_009339 [Aristolochia fimbriata]|uniref:Ribosomal protein S19 n=1 Tax=Aristolochia fimbriata TaxID=158543 RepID=A0AAV7EL49_ARIFI|nr:hypothetical protein H6P81_009339 [Aristolochia fimbriata]
MMWRPVIRFGHAAFCACGFGLRGGSGGESGEPQARSLICEPYTTDDKNLWIRDNNNVTLGGARRVVANSAKPMPRLSSSYIRSLFNAKVPEAIATKSGWQALGDAYHAAKSLRTAQLFLIPFLHGLHVLVHGHNPHKSPIYFKLKLVGKENRGRGKSRHRR